MAVKCRLLNQSKFGKRRCSTMPVSGSDSTLGGSRASPSFLNGSRGASYVGKNEMVFMNNMGTEQLSQSARIDRSPQKTLVNIHRYCSNNQILAAGSYFFSKGSTFHSRSICTLTTTSLIALVFHIFLYLHLYQKSFPFHSMVVSDNQALET
ncbi:hypothetical protein E6O75_ATG09447 [Venturia nashicola]|uniref:Uncharacterized protein n=1 Tax=Venturia nashicola TaxID=86259 RepID=A0A4Z1P3G9_9PEZI|nr:hypothetical protein E6O75_ATG09447 [Venturia nashicola]